MISIKRRMRTMAARLRLATLEDMEENQQSQQRRPARPQLSHLYRERSQGPVEHSLPRTHCHVGQILYAKDVQKNYPAWKRWVANNVHIPLFRWFEKSLGLFPPTGMRIIDDVYVWNSLQGCYLSEEDAHADAARYPHGYVVPNVPLGNSLPEAVPEKSSVYFADREGTMAIDLTAVRDELSKLRSAVHAARF